jgi:hypothetical protein
MQERMKVKYNKKRNTAFLYETLVKELTKAVVNKDNNKRVIILGILKEHFSSSSVLYKELDVYKSLYETKGVDPDIAQRMIQEARRVYSSLNPQSIFNQQTQVINKMNKQLESSIFSNFLGNYKHLATISQLFDDNVSIKHRVLLEKKVLDILCENEIEKEEMRPIDNIVYKQVIKKFNDKYSDVLLKEQKELFSKYILSYADDVDFMVYLNEEIVRINKIFNETNTISFVEKQQLIEKIDELKNKPVDKQIVESVLHFQSLVKELQD